VTHALAMPTHSTPNSIPTTESAEQVQARLLAILDASQDCIITIDHEGLITDFNASAEKTFGYPRSQALGREMAELIVPPSLRERHRAGLRRLVETGQSTGMLGRRMEVPALCSNGSEIPVELTITQIAHASGRPCFAAYLRNLSEQKRTEATLAENAAQQREARDYFEKSFNSSPAFMSIARADNGRIIAANPSFVSGSGLTLEEVINKTTEELGLWLLPQARTEFLARIRKDHAVRDFEADFRGKTKISTLLLNADILELRGIPCIFTVGIDITERRRRDLFQSVTYEIAHTWLAGDDLPTLLTKVHKIIGRLMPTKNFYVALLNPERSLITFPYFVDESGARPEPRPPTNSVTELVLQTQEPLLATFDQIVEKLTARGPFSPKPNTVPCAQWMGAPLIVDGRSVGVIALQDYHNPKAYSEEDKKLLSFVADQVAAAIQRQEIEAARARAEQQFRSIFENSLEGLYQSSPNGRFLKANPALARILGFPSADSLLHAQWAQLYVDPQRSADFLKLIDTSDEITDFESEVHRANGGTIWISQSVRVMRSADGEIDHFEGVAVNVTAQREAASALKRAKEEADAASRAKSTFLASMSHELRTPLNGILGYAQILKRDDLLNPKQRDAIGIIHSSADHLLNLINDVLDLSKIEAHKLELHPTEFDLRDFALSVTNVFIPRAQEKNLTLETVISTDLPSVVKADEQRLRQVVFNLLGNAIKFTHQGGVVFAIEQAPDPALVRISVTDSGPGIHHDDQHKLFQPFTQVGDEHQRTAGTGLGLAISSSIVNQMGGTLHHESKTGSGARFWFDLALPASLANATQPVVTARIIGYEGPRRRILVADDHPANRSLLVDLLIPLGFLVSTANDGEQAIQSATDVHTRPDLVLLDLRMPRVDGLVAAQTIRGSFASKNQPAPVLVGVSASAFHVDRQTFLAAGCADFLAKPFREDQLLGLISHHLGLAWTYAGVPSSGETQFITRAATSASETIVPPATADLEELLRLANNGDVLGVRTLAEGLSTQHPDLLPFCRQIIELAARYKMKAIRQLLARYRSVP